MKYFVILMLVTGSVSASEYLRPGEKVTPHPASNAFAIEPKTTVGTVDRSNEYNQPKTVGAEPKPWAIKQDARRYEVKSKKPCFAIKCK